MQDNVELKNQIGMAEKELSQLCENGGRTWHLSIPVQPTDSDTLFADMIRAAKRLAAMPRPATGWMPIESAPKDGTEIIAFGSYIYPSDKDRTIYYMLAEWDKDSWCTYEGSHGDGFFTHWMPLPPAPEGE